MLESVIKYFAIILCCIYTYYRLLNIKQPEKLQLTLHFIFTVALSIMIHYLRLYLPYFNNIAMILAICIYLKFITQTDLTLSIVTTIISAGYSYIFYIITSLIVSLILNAFGIPESFPGEYLMIIVSAIFISLMWIPFRFKRLRKGMPFLIEKGTNGIGITVSVVILSFIVYTNNSSLNLLYTIIFIGILICSAILLFWWRKQIQRSYQRKLKENEFTQMKTQLLEKDRQID